MGKSREKRPRPVIKEHIKWKGLSDKGKARYRRAIFRFLEWRKLAELSKPRKITALEYQCGEFVIFLYQDDRPIYWAGDFLSGMKRCYMQGRRACRTASRYYGYWIKGTPVKRALPISSELVRGMAAYFVIKGRPRMAVAFLVAFYGFEEWGRLPL